MPLAAHVHLGPQSTLRCPKTQRRPVGNLKVTSTVEPAHQPPHERNFQQSRDCFTRRGIMLAGFGLTSWNLGQQAASANAFQDLIVSRVRPELEKDEAIVMLMDAKGTLTELSDLAATPSDSQERFKARNRLPGMAKRLREVGPAAPVVAAAVSGNLREAGVSKKYGGQGGLQAATDAVYQSIGQIITISGRTIRKEAQAAPNRADEAISHIDDLLSQLPAGDTAKAEAFRKTRQLMT